MTKRGTAAIAIVAEKGKQVYGFRLNDNLRICFCVCGILR